MKEKEFDFVIYPLKLMSLGFKVGEDEHAAYIAGFVGNCAGEMFGFLEEEKDGKEE